jgi:uncharacterized membrane protein YphA (DoxX/SURF4 family)
MSEPRVYAVARSAVAFVFAWHGLVPKLIFEDQGELQPLLDAGFDAETALTVVHVAGWMEITFAVLLVVLWRARWPLWVVVVGMVTVAIATALTSPQMFRAAFQPLTLNLCMGALAWIALAVDARSDGRPSGRSG